MGRTAISKLDRADVLDKKSRELKSRDPEASAQLKDMARSERKKAIRQMRRRPGKRNIRIVGR